MPTWTFVRHGQSVANHERWLAGHHDTPLTDRGRAEAIAARASLPRPLPPRAFCSDLQRAHQTARLLLEDEPRSPFVTHRLRERDLGAWTRRTIEELSAMGDPHARIATWRGRPPGGESLLDVALRVATWAASLDEPADTLIVAHGALMRAVLAAIDRLPRDEVGAQRPHNCEVISRSLAPGAWAELRDELRAESADRPA